MEAWIRAPHSLRVQDTSHAHTDSFWDDLIQGNTLSPLVAFLALLLARSYLVSGVLVWALPLCCKSTSDLEPTVSPRDRRFPLPRSHLKETVGASPGEGVGPWDGGWRRCG